MEVIRKRNKIWYVDYYYKSNRYIKAISPHKQVAELALKDIEVKIAKEEHLGIHATGKITFDSFSKKYLEYSHTNKAVKTYERDIIFIENIYNYKCPCSSGG